MAFMLQKNNQYPLDTTNIRKLDYGVRLVADTMLCLVTVGLVFTYPARPVRQRISLLQSGIDPYAGT